MEKTTNEARRCIKLNQRSSKLRRAVGDDPADVQVAGRHVGGGEAGDAVAGGALSPPVGAQVQRRGAAAQRAGADGRLSGGGRCRLKLQR